MTNKWTPTSYLNFPSKQQPQYDNKEELHKAVAKLTKLPPIVTPHEIDQLNTLLSDAYSNQKFILQGGDCAESFEDCHSELIDVKIKILLQMSLIISWIAEKPTIRIGRIGGQYSKPRSSNFETLANGETIPSFRGDSINDLDDRKHDPKRMVDAYFHSVSTVNYIRGLLKSGFADLHASKSWVLDYVHSEGAKELYLSILNPLLRSIQFMDVCGVSEVTSEGMRAVDFYTSHEALLLPYESALTRCVSNCYRKESPQVSRKRTRVNSMDNLKEIVEDYIDETNITDISQNINETKYYNLSAHYLWLGDRTRDIDGAHLEYLSGIENPIGVKIGPSMDMEKDLVPLCQKLNPKRIPGKLTLVLRFGAKKAQDKINELCHLLDKYQNEIPPVLLQVDPMHGNTETTSTGIKTRHFNNVLDELIIAVKTLKSHNRQLNGVHFELTGEDVTECIGGQTECLGEDDLKVKYTTRCDPRLNYSQSMDLAFRLAAALREE